MYYLYLKTHNVTGLKYLGKTVGDPYTYKGSGTGWKEHLDKYGYDVTTEVLCADEDIRVVRAAAAKYQRNLNITKLDEFANRIAETVPGKIRPVGHVKHFSGDDGPRDLCICPKCKSEIRTVYHYKDCQPSVG